VVGNESALPLLSVMHIVTLDWNAAQEEMRNEGESFRCICPGLCIIMPHHA
jgi:hypothetical protein